LSLLYSLRHSTVLRPFYMGFPLPSRMLMK
jgi:hypothetical protein